MEREENIERYLYEEMNPSERQAFELAMEKDPSLQMEVVLYRDLDTHLQDAKRVEVNQKVVAVGADFFKNFNPNQQKDTTPPPKASSRSWIWIIGIGFLFFLTWSFFLKPKSVTMPPVSTEIEIPKYFEEEQESKELDTPPMETQTEESEENTALPITPTFPTKEKPKNTPNQPIAAADPTAFVPNPILEDLVKQAVRTTTYSIAIETPQNNQRFAYQPKTNIQIKGKIENFTMTRRAGFDLFIFDNDPEHFANEQDLLQYRLPLKEEADETYSFSFNANLELRKGLYYFYILDIKTKGLPYTGKFLVE